ncbi:MAG: hypothetical protein KDA59_22945, partial [Planctomycetales bacterium]|nr:hypothetical protein [Planctomycetales bacterium]
RWKIEYTPRAPGMDWEGVDWLSTNWPLIGPYPHNQWSEIATDSCLEDEMMCRGIGTPASGHIAVTPRLRVGGIEAFLETPREMVAIDYDVKWVGFDPGDGETNYYPAANPSAFGGGDILYAEKYTPQGRDHDKISVEVTISPVLPPGFQTEMHVSSYDPDHYSDDPEFDDDFEDRADLARDNMYGRGFFIDNSHTLVFVPGVESATATLQVRGQPGNNYIVAARRYDPWLVQADFPDGDTLYWYEFVQGGPDTPVGPVEDSYRTALLSIWRTLHIEPDSLGTPSSIGPITSDPHAWDPNEEDDPYPGNIEITTQAIDALSAAFFPAMIEVKDDLQDYDVSDDASFYHYLHQPLTQIVAAGSVRDVDSENGFWTIQVFAAYDRENGTDNDPNGENSALGTSHTVADSVVFVFTETIRDIQDYGFAACGSVPSGLLDRVVLHELAHQFGMYHTFPAGDEGPLDVDESICGFIERMYFTPRQLRIIQRIDRPGEVS